MGRRRLGLQNPSRGDKDNTQAGTDVHAHISHLCLHRHTKLKVNTQSHTQLKNTLVHTRAEIDTRQQILTGTRLYTACLEARHPTPQRGPRAVDWQSPLNSPHLCGGSCLKSLRHEELHSCSELHMNLQNKAHRDTASTYSDPITVYPLSHACSLHTHSFRVRACRLH